VTERSASRTTAPPLLVVDAANVIGARPDGWWRDRPGAVRRLLAALSSGLSDADGEVVVVLEGAGRTGAAEGTTGGLRVVHAVGSGDDAVVEIVGRATGAGNQRPVTVATADRGLRERVEALGARTLGPRTLWDRLGDNGRLGK
jgi:hypothetical protein